jgi:hypothetical protein
MVLGNCFGSGGGIQAVDSLRRQGGPKRGGDSADCKKYAGTESLFVLTDYAFGENWSYELDPNASEIRFPRTMKKSETDLPTLKRTAILREKRLSIEKLEVACSSKVLLELFPHKSKICDRCIWVWIPLQVLRGSTFYRMASSWSLIVFPLKQWPSLLFCAPSLQHYYLIFTFALYASCGRTWLPCRFWTSPLLCIPWNIVCTL